MTNRKKPPSIWIVSAAVLFAVVFGGCVTLSGTAKPNPKLAAQYLEKGQELEKQADLPSALEQYKLALTADPQNEAALQNSERLSKQLSSLANARYDLGMKYHRQGKYALARKEFLTALKFQPDHPGASQMLVSRQPEKAPEYVLHEIQKGESLSIIANKYYGDFKKFDVIAQFNGIQDATLVKPGQTIKIPMLTGTMPPSADFEADLKHSDFVLHTIEPGESISKLAQIYYGDYHKFHIIAQFNRMDDATQVKVGDKVRIPKVAGLPFNLPTDDQSSKSAEPLQPRIAKTPAPPASTAAASATDKSASELPQTLQPQEADKTSPDNNEQILAYRDAGIDLYNEGRYEDAIFELNKTVEALPQDQQTRTYLAKAYFESGKKLLTQKEYDSAKEAFESALQFNPKCAECKSYIDKSKSGPFLVYRSKGVDAFNRNEFGEAITAFHQYLQVQPGDADARTYLGKAYFQKALIDYNKTDYMGAKKEFESALEYDSQCEKCSTYIKQSLESHKEFHYNKGVVHYGRQQLEEAINEWELVYGLDPGYKEVSQNLTKARALMEKLEQIKKSQKQK